MTTTDFWPDRCLGTMFFGTRIDRDTSFALLDRWVESGGRLLDTANNYAVWEPDATGDESETLLGEWFAAHGNRDEMLVASKIGARPKPGTRGFGSAEGLGARAVASQVAGSLERLGTTRLDAVYAHIDDRTTPLARTLSAFDALVQDGTIGTIACSNYEAPRLRAALGTSEREGLARYTAIQVRSTYLTPRDDADFGVQVPFGPELAAVTQATGTVVLGYSSLLEGAYSRDDRPVPATYRHERTDAQLAALHAVASRLDVTANQVVYAWQRSEGIVPVLGVSRLAQLDEAIGAHDVVLDDAARSELAAARG